MQSYLRRRPRTIGAAPGVLGESGVDATPLRVRATRYGVEGEAEVTEYAPGDELPRVREGTVLWVDLVGHEDVSGLARVAREYGIPGLVLEDAIDVTQRPLFTSGEGWGFLSIRRVAVHSDDAVRREQLGLFLTDGLVVTFQEIDGDGWDPIRRRIADPTSTLRKHGADYLWYRLADAIVDEYFLVMERIAERVERVEEDIFESLPDDVPMRLGAVRKESVILRRAARPVAEALDRAGLEEAPIFTRETRRLLADVREHATQVAEVNEVMREAVGANMDTYISLVGMRQNEVMRVLTLVATIFIPLTFIAGVYGMNFTSMPELSQPWGYPAVWAVMILTTLGLVVYFRRKGWL